MIIVAFVILISIIVTQQSETNKEIEDLQNKINNLKRDVSNDNYRKKPKCPEFTMRMDCY